LRQSAGNFARTSEKLASGRKVQSALDNPTNFFAATGLKDQTFQLAQRLDALSQADRMIKASTDGVSSIRQILSALKGAVNAAVGTTDPEQREDFGRQFNQLLVQANSLAADSSYQGQNLLRRNISSTVQFGAQANSSVLKLKGLDIRTTASAVDSNGNLPVKPIKQIPDIPIGATTVDAESGYAPNSPITPEQGVELLSTSIEGIDEMLGQITALKQIISNAKATSDPADRELLGRDFNLGLVSISDIGRFATSLGNNLLWWNDTVAVDLGSNTEMRLEGFAVRTSNSVDGQGNLGSINYMLELNYPDKDVFLQDEFGNPVAGEAVILLGGNPIISPVHPPGDPNYYINYGIQGSVIGAAPIAGSVDWKDGNYLNILTAVDFQLDKFDEVLSEQKSRYASQLSGLQGTTTGISSNPAFASFGITDAEGKTYGIQSAQIGSQRIAGTIDWKGAGYASSLKRVVQQIEASDAVLQRQMGRLVQYISTITLREDFMREQINVRTEGADKLVLADIDEESANLLAA
jgi:flagellin-like hook-associated protein FlgL